MRPLHNSFCPYLICFFLQWCHYKPIEVIFYSWQFFYFFVCRNRHKIERKNTIRDYLWQTHPYLIGLITWLAFDNLCLILCISCWLWDLLRGWRPLAVGEGVLLFNRHLIKNLSRGEICFAKFILTQSKI